MVDILRRSFAPITEDAWSEIEDTAKDVLRTFLTARKLVDVDGPNGWEQAAVNLGKLKVVQNEPIEDVHWGKRDVLPLIELRIPFFLNQMEVDTIERGSKDADLEPLETAAKKIAKFEDMAIFNGFKDGGIGGILDSSPHSAIQLSNEADQFPKSVAEAVIVLKQEGIPGPYSLVLGTKPYEILNRTVGCGYPPQKMIDQLLLGGDTLWSPAVEGGVLISARGGDFELTIGQDLSIGYANHDREKIELYLTESLTFRVIEPAAAVPFTL